MTSSRGPQQTRIVVSCYVPVLVTTGVDVTVSRPSQAARVVLRVRVFIALRRLSVACVSCVAALITRQLARGGDTPYQRHVSTPWVFPSVGNIPQYNTVLSCGYLHKPRASHNGNVPLWKHESASQALSVGYVSSHSGGVKVHYRVKVHYKMYSHTSSTTRLRPQRKRSSHRQHLCRQRLHRRRRRG